MKPENSLDIVLKVRLILYNKGKILLLKQTKANGGNYTLVGGTIEQHEFARESLVRETLEEAGIEIVPQDLVLAHVLHKRVGKGQRITLYFKTSRWEGKAYAREPQKFKAVAWFPLHALPKNLTPTVAPVLEHYRRAILFSEFKK